MSKFYVCSENHSIIGQMDTYLAFNRDKLNSGGGGGVEKPQNTHIHQQHRHSEVREKPLPTTINTSDHQRLSEKPYNVNMPSVHDLGSEDTKHSSRRQSHAHHNGHYHTHHSHHHHNPKNVSPDSSPYPVMERDEPSDEALNQAKFRNGNTVTLTPEMFEKIYLSPQTNVKGDLRSTFGNPTPLALLGFLLSLSPLSCELMGWRGAGGDGIATIGTYYFFGGFLMSLGGILEFFLGNTFSFVVFCSFGGFWFTLGATLTPAFNAYGAYALDPAHPEKGLTSPSFHASFGFFLLFMGVMSFIYLICALRTNLVFVAIFAGLLLTFVVLTGSYWQLAQGNVQFAAKLQVGAGAFGFMAVMAGWWIFFAQMLQTVDFPIVIPVGDISHLITPLSARVKKTERYSA